ncbi:MAG: putative CRISPR-associated protein, partial [Candidatus Binatia bacterium]
MATRKFVLTTVGISILLNSLEREEEEWRRRLNQAANAPALPEDVQRKVDELCHRGLMLLRQRNVQKNRGLSAELNGLYGLYADQLEHAKGDMHFLIATDTDMGRKAACVIEEFLREQGVGVNTYIPPHLSAREPVSFSRGIKDLMRWCEENIPPYRQKQYHVIFNLTAAFKSLQGYLNIVGMFYADQIVYIFETSAQLLSIPRLPVRVDIEALRAHRVELALMAYGHIYAADQVQGIPAGLLEIDEKGDASLSDWGALIWNRVRAELLGDDLLPFPRLQYTDSFRKDFKQA